jgi:hypothetical protein
MPGRSRTALPFWVLQELLGHARVSPTKGVYAVHELQTLWKGFEQFNPTISEQVAELEVERQRRHRT